MSNSHKNNMFINLISDHPTNVGKAIRFGRKFLEAGWEVTLSVNIDAIQVLNPEAELGPCPVAGKPLLELLQLFLAEGGRTLVGKECLKLAGLQENDLPEGLEIAAFPVVEELMSIPDLKIITW